MKIISKKNINGKNIVTCQIKVRTAEKLMRSWKAHVKACGKSPQPRRLLVYGSGLGPQTKSQQNMAAFFELSIAECHQKTFDKFVKEINTKSFYKTDKVSVIKLFSESEIVFILTFGNNINEPSSFGCYFYGPEVFHPILKGRIKRLNLELKELREYARPIKPRPQSKKRI